MSKQARRRSALSKLVASAPFTAKFVAGKLGYELCSFRMVMSGYRSLPPEKQKLLAMLLSIPEAKVAKAAKETKR